ncbi:hypothetical protein QE152_g11262 [Popillia japonica]|uniref:Uncharacterized protein n=1 Tax=Popillia japonica TaxID=7064 RepID=A0AAW1LQP2_POPJA
MHKQKRRFPAISVGLYIKRTALTAVLHNLAVDEALEVPEPELEKLAMGANQMLEANLEKDATTPEKTSVKHLIKSHSIKKAIAEIWAKT